MIFSSLSFLYLFLPVLFLFYYPVRNTLWRSTVLLVFSLLFYAWGAPEALPLLLATCLVVWLCGRIAVCRGAGTAGKIAFAFALLFLMGSLFVYKYLGFFAGIAAAVAGKSFSVPQLLLPAGISFYTFQMLSWLIDLRRGSLSEVCDFPRFLLYVCFFPQLLQGPIVRYGTMAPDLGDRTVRREDLLTGSRRFLLGLAKKVLLADQMAFLSALIYDAPSLPGTAALWLASFCYTLQIYFDFSGYSDMAVGLGLLFGFHLPENFRYPYAATSVTDFWRRWHITLSQWFRDYVYIPLGGSRAGKRRLVINILTVWALTGLWHGASWNFVLWGLYYGLLLLAEKLLLAGRLERIPRLLRHVLTILLVDFGWVLFHISDSGRLLAVIKGMFLYRPTDWASLLSLDTAVCSRLLFLPAAAVFCFPVLEKLRRAECGMLSVLMVHVCYAGLFLACILILVSSSFSPFIYFNF